MSFVAKALSMQSQSNYASDKAFRLEQTEIQQNQYRKLTKLAFASVILACSFMSVGCNTLQALEPTAILISDIKNSS